MNRVTKVMNASRELALAGAVIVLSLAGACAGDGSSRDAGARSSPAEPQVASPSGYVNPTAGAELAYQIEGMHEAEVRPDVVFARGLEMDVYRPTGSPSGDALPAVLLGGPVGVAGKDSGQKVGWAQLLAASGIAAVTFDTRDDGGLSAPEEPVRDVASAVDFVVDNGADLGIDQARLCTLGFSMGTAPWHLAATMGQPSPVRCNVAYYPALDLMDPRFGLDPADGRRLSPLALLRREPEVPPMLVVKAARDENEPINDSVDAFVEAAREMDAPVRLLTHPTGGHAFDVGMPDPETDAVIRSTLDFFAEHLGP